MDNEIITEDIISEEKICESDFRNITSKEDVDENQETNLEETKSGENDSKEIREDSNLRETVVITSNDDDLVFREPIIFSYSDNTAEESKNIQIGNKVEDTDGEGKEENKQETFNEEILNEQEGAKEKEVITQCEEEKLIIDNKGSENIDESIVDRELFPRENQSTDIETDNRDSLPIQQKDSEGDALVEKEATEDKEETKKEDFLSSSIDEEFANIISADILEIVETSIEEIRQTDERIPIESMGILKSTESLIERMSKSKSHPTQDEFLSSILDEQKKRENLIAKLRDMKNEYQLLIHFNRFLQSQLADYFYRKKVEIGLEIIEVTDLNVLAASEARYIKLLEVVKDFHLKRNELSKSCAEEIKSAEIKAFRIKNETEEKWEQYCQYRKQKLKTAIWAQNNKRLKEEEVNGFIVNETAIEDQLSIIRLKVMHWEQAVERKTHEFHSYGSELESMGLKLIDYEQMRQENAVLRAKYEARCADAKKLKKKVAVVNGAVTHFKEGLEKKREKNRETRSEMMKLDFNLDIEREDLNYWRVLRDKVKASNTRLRDRTGLLGKESLLHDFERNILKLRTLKNHFKSIHHSYVDTAKAIIHTRWQAGIVTEDNSIRDFTKPRQRTTIIEPSFNATREPIEDRNRRQSLLPAPERPFRPSIIPKNANF